ncbi:nucleotide exchange factor GrpE [Elusimicrobiota bacterium]
MGEVGNKEPVSVEEEARQEKLAEQEILEQALEAKDKKIKEYEDKLLRAKAEFENLRKRTEREKAEVYAYGTSQLLMRLLSFTDTFDKAYNELLNSKGVEKNMKEGFTMLFAMLGKLLADEGVKQIEVLEGSPYDPNFHEVVRVEEKPDSDGKIIKVEQNGFMLGDRLLRPARVAVSKKRE